MKGILIRPRQRVMTALAKLPLLVPKRLFHLTRVPDFSGTYVMTGAQGSPTRLDGFGAANTANVVGWGTIAPAKTNVGNEPILAVWGAAPGGSNFFAVMWGTAPAIDHGITAIDITIDAQPTVRCTFDGYAYSVLSPSLCAYITSKLGVPVNVVPVVIP